MPALLPPRRRILDAARALFTAQGVTATGVDAISARAGVSKRTLYREFGSKEALTACYLREFGDPGVLPAEDLLADAARPGRDRLLAAFAVLADDAARGGWRGCPATAAAVEIADAAHPARTVAHEHKERFRGRVSAALRDAGVAEAAVGTLALRIAVLWDGALVQAVVQRTAAPVHEARALVAELLDAALPGLPGAAPRTDAGGPAGAAGRAVQPARG